MNIGKPFKDVLMQNSVVVIIQINISKNKFNFFDEHKIGIYKNKKVFED